MLGVTGVIKGCGDGGHCLFYRMGKILRTVPVVGNCHARSCQGVGGRRQALTHFRGRLYIAAGAGGAECGNNR